MGTQCHTGVSLECRDSTAWHSTAPLSRGRRRVVLRGALLPTELAILPRRECESLDA